MLAQVRADPTTMSFPLRIADQLKPHLRALRKSLGLTQSRLGVLVGVKQARIAEIEANPGAVSLDQLTKVLAALGATLHLHSADIAGPECGVVPAAVPKKPQPAPRSAAKQAPNAVVRRSPSLATKSAPRTGIVIRPKKGAW
jgi:HTH-type transcriptional regulator/antitoxin HipB